jgi:hypothetical protein
MNGRTQSTKISTLNGSYLETQPTHALLNIARSLSSAASLADANPQHITPRVGFYFLCLIARN